MMEEDFNSPCKLSMEAYGVETNWKYPGSEVDVQMLLEAFTGMLVSHTFHYTMVLEEMKKFAETHLGIANKYLKTDSE